MADNDQLLGVDFNLNPDPKKQVADQAPDYHDLLVGDGKKYADDANLAKGYANLSAHAKTILDEKVALEQEVIKLRQSTSTVDSILAQLKVKPTEPLSVEPQGGDPVLTQDAIADLITSALDQRTAAQSQQTQADKTAATQQETWTKLAEMYGDMEKAKAAAQMYIGNDAAKKSLFQQVGSSDPETLAKIMATAVPPTAAPIDFGNIETKQLPNSKETVAVPTGLMTYAQAEVVRKKDPRLYNSRQFQTRLHQSSATLAPEKFWEGIKRQGK